MRWSLRNTQGVPPGSPEPCDPSRPRPASAHLSLSPELPLSPSTPAPTAPPSAAEQTPAARIGAVLFRNRGWLPVPFLLVPLLASGGMTLRTTILGAVLMLLGEAWRMWGVATAGTVTRRRSRNVQKLVNHGPFAWSRNPLYVGNFLIWMGVITLSGVLWFLPVAILLFAVEYFYIVRYEEGVLESIFGREYLDYKTRVPRWMPRPPAGGSAGEFAWAEAWKSEISTFLQYGVIIGLFIGKERLGPLW